MKAVSLILIVCSVYWSGCASAPPIDATPPVDVPSTWSNSGTESSPCQPWLNDFKSDTLNALVAEAIDNNPDLRVVAARFDQTAAEAKITGAQRRPNASLGLAGARQKVNSIGPQQIPSNRFETYELDLNLSWEIDLWGKLNDRSSAALARVEASAAELRSAELSLAGQVAKSWFNYIESEAQFQLATTTAQSWLNNLKALESRFQRGLADGLDLRRVRTQKAGAEAAVETTRRARDAAARNLETLLGRYPSASLQAESEFTTLPTTVPAGLPTDLLKRRPDLIAAERNLASAQKELSASKKELLPSISFNANGGTRSNDFEDLLDENFSVWALAGNLSQPLFQGGRIRAGIERSKALTVQAAETYRNLALRAFQEVETTLAAETFLRNEYERLRIASEEATAAETLAWSRYRKGTSSFLSALDSQRTATDARSRLLQLRNLLLQNRVDLYLALGGPFARES